MKPFQLQSEALWWATANRVGPCCVRVLSLQKTDLAFRRSKEWIGIFDGRHFIFYDPRTATVEVHASYTIIDEVNE